MSSRAIDDGRVAVEADAHLVEMPPEAGRVGVRHGPGDVLRLGEKVPGRHRVHEVVREDALERRAIVQAAELIPFHLHDSLTRGVGSQAAGR